MIGYLLAAGGASGLVAGLAWWYHGSVVRGLRTQLDAVAGRAAGLEATLKVVRGQLAAAEKVADAAEIQRNAALRDLWRERAQAARKVTDATTASDLLRRAGVRLRDPGGHPDGDAPGADVQDPPAPGVPGRDPRRP